MGRDLSSSGFLCIFPSHNNTNVQYTGDDVCEPSIFQVRIVYAGNAWGGCVQAIFGRWETSVHDCVLGVVDLKKNQSHCMANMFLMPLETRTQEIKILRQLNSMQAQFAYRFLANFGWGTLSRPKYYDLKNVRWIVHTIRKNINDEKNTSFSLPVWDTNMWFWGRGRFLMRFYIGGKNESASFVFSQLKTEKIEMGYTFLTALDK